MKNIENIKIELNTKTGVFDVLFGGVCFGKIDDLQEDQYCFFSTKQDRLSGDHYIAIGKALNELNLKK